MKLSVSLPAPDVAFLDEYARSMGIASRSAALHKAVRLLKAAQLGVAYEEAFEEWESRGEGAVWDVTTTDGASLSA